MQALYGHQRMAISLLLICSIALLAGCGSQVAKQPARPLPAEHLLNRNYVTGEPKIVNVGDAMVIFKDYWIIKSKGDVATIDRTVEIRLGDGDLVTYLERGKSYPILGQITDESRVFTLIEVGQELHAPVGFAAMVKPDGSLHNHLAILQKGGLLNGNALTSRTEATISDPTARVSLDGEQAIDMHNGYANFEILYTGINSSGLNLMYREFSPENVARVAFYQNLTYPADSSIITFKNYKIEVHEANSESITFTVLQE